VSISRTHCANAFVEEQTIACRPRLVLSAAAVSKCYWLKGTLTKVPLPLCAEHARQLGGASPLPSLMETKG
jgi:hypothetical protein